MLPPCFFYKAPLIRPQKAIAERERERESEQPVGNWHRAAKMRVLVQVPLCIILLVEGFLSTVYIEINL